MRRPSVSDAEALRINTLEGAPIYGGDLIVRPLIHGEQMTWLEIRYPAGVRTPMHSHTHESIVYVVSGKLKATIETDVFVMGPGDVARHPKGVLHSVEAIEDSVIMECKSPAPDITAFMVRR